MSADEPAIGVHPSVRNVFPQWKLHEELDDVAADVELLAGGADLDGLDALLAFSFEEAFLPDRPLAGVARYRRSGCEN